MAQQTAVEWLVEEINKINVSTEARLFINKLKEQAKQMEKEQIENAWAEGWQYGWHQEDDINAEQYYNETYNTQNSQPLVSGSLPSKDEVVNKGYIKAKNADYNYRRSLRDLDHDLYFSGWMDCYDWLSGNDR